MKKLLATPLVALLMATGVGTVATTALVAPAAYAATNPAAPVISVSGATISWPAVPTADGYNVYRNGSYLTTISARTYTATASGSYTVTAFDNDVSPTTYSVSSNAKTVTVGSSSRPAAPVISLSGATISWPAVPTANGYNVYRDGSYLTTIGALSYTATASGSYTVTAFDNDVSPTTYSVSSNAKTVTVGSGSYTTIFSDGFDGSSVSSKFYVPSWTSGNRFATNNKDACSQGGGYLNLAVKKVGSEHHACYLISNDTFGPGSDSTIKIAYRANVSQVQAKGAWMAGWMYPLGKNSQGVDYAADGLTSTGSEYDVFEYTPTWDTAFNSAVHDGRGSNDPSKWTDGKGVKTGWHTYTLEWNKGCQVYSVDGAQVWKVSDANVISQATNHHVMLTMEAQTGTSIWTGTSIGDFPTNLSQKPATAQVDSVTVSKKNSIDTNLCNG